VERTGWRKKSKKPARAGGGEKRKALLKGTLPWEVIAVWEGKGVRQSKNKTSGREEKGPRKREGITPFQTG